MTQTKKNSIPKNLTRNKKKYKLKVFKILILDTIVRER